MQLSLPKLNVFPFTRKTRKKNNNNNENNMSTDRSETQAAPDST